MINYLLLEHYLITLVLGIGSVTSLVEEAMEVIKDAFIGIPYKVLLDVHKDPEEDAITMFLIVKNNLELSDWKIIDTQIEEWLLKLSPTILTCFSISMY